ncbi:hypothetical protein AcV5_000366 [Taiwanofungus camphoratus]|nr:hypothetical protein AcV5_000366 [Antrodia cinnamomea]
MSSHAGPSRSPREAVTHGQDHQEADLYGLIAQLDLQDLNEIRDGRRNNQPLTDGELVLQLAAEEATSFAAVQRDHALVARLSIHGDDDSFHVADPLHQERGRTPPMLSPPRFMASPQNNTHVHDSNSASVLSNKHEEQGRLASHGPVPASGESHEEPAKSPDWSIFALHWNPVLYSYAI